MDNYTNNEESIAMLCHELRSPLTSIKGYLCALKDGVIPQDKQEDYINTVLAESDRMMDMIESFMIMTKVNSKNPVLNMEIFDINKLISDIASNKKEIPSSDCRINTEYDFAEDVLNVKADKSLLHEVIVNLIDNAIKYGKRDNCADITLSTSLKGNKAYITVRDHGNGIPEEYIPLIWDKYFTTSATKHSLGMGLYLTKSIINAHGEKISVKSVQNKGTEFTFTLFACDLE